MALTQVTEKGIKDGEIVNADVNASAAIAKSKLASLDIVNADVNASAAIAGSKLAASTTSVAGSMSAADKTKLDGVAASANNYTHPTSNGNKHIPADGSAGQFLKYDSAGTAVWAADNDTVYTHPNHSGDVTSSGDGATTIADNAVTLAKMAGGTDGQIITYDASGDPVAVGPGTDGQVLTSTGAGSPPAFEDAAGGLFSAWAHVFELQSGGTAGGTFTNGAMRTRVLNGESDPSNIVSLSSNQFTLAAGNYLIVWSAPAYRTNQHVSVLYNATGTAIEARGSAEYSEGGIDQAQTRSVGYARVSPSGSTAYEIQHQTGVTRDNNGFGKGMGGQTYIFTSVQIFKEA